mgnify:CR=1 FL=1
MSRVAIVSYAMEGFSSESDSDARKAVASVARDAYDQAGIERDDLDALVMTDQDAFDGAAISSGIKVAPAGGYLKPVMRVQNGGGYGIHQGMAKIRSGKADCVAVVAADTTKTDATVVSNISQEPLYHRPFGESNVTSHARLATEYLETGVATEEDFARVAAKNYAGAAETPWAHRREGHSTESVLESERVASPLRELMTAPVSYGAAIVVLASESFVEDHDLEPAWLAGAGVGSSNYGYTTSESRLEQPALEKAATAAYDGAGIDDPAEAFDAAEVCAPAPHYELLSYETLGLCDRGDAPSLVRDGTTAHDGSLPVNVCGGALATNPPSSGGLVRAITGAKLVNGEFDHVDQSVQRALVTDSDLHLGERGRTDAALVLEAGGAA